ncbi:MAG TPA: hypothetical protein PKG54_10390 [Phycisphaerae bacterium]|nr:hypothetical protein [Phycisphaerae bacterium]HOB74923.1 hypothetical protein [Phycisphaerae bacterium]HOL25800.1 hypothetical protein [Phycisphaerae bacterium]HPU32621.1 hypothetical protein [Phycisphaerae bacterium]HQA44854.1 hypothetical protein [Phycisphaerae bacterium]
MGWGEGEDSARAIKQEFDADRLWGTACTNDVPCCIHSRRILAEGGYEAGENMVHFDRPARLKPELKNRILEAVRQLVPPGYTAWD